MSFSPAPFALTVMAKGFSERLRDLHSLASVASRAILIATIDLPDACDTYTYCRNGAAAAAARSSYPRSNCMPRPTSRHWASGPILRLAPGFTDHMAMNHWLPA